jgi:hypothetical protein
VVDWSAAPAAFKAAVEAFLQTRGDALAGIPCPPIRAELLSCIDQYLGNTDPSPAFHNWAIHSARAVIARPRSPLPGQDSLLTASADLLLKHQPSTETVLALLDTQTQQCRLTVLHRMSALSRCWTTEVLDRILGLAVDGKSGEVVQTAALNAVSSDDVIWSEDAVQSIPMDRRRSVRIGLVQLLSARCIPLREAALPATAWAIRNLGEVKEDVGLERLAKEISVASMEDQVSLPKTSIDKAQLTDSLNLAEKWPYSLLPTSQLRCFLPAPWARPQIPFSPSIRVYSAFCRTTTRTSGSSLAESCRLDSACRGLLRNLGP